MKIILIVVSVILAATAGGSGYYIYSLNGQINDLENELKSEIASSFDELESNLSHMAARLEEADTELEEALASSNESIYSAIAGTNSLLTSFTQTTGDRFTEVEGDIENNRSEIDGLQTDVTNTQNVINTSVLKSQELYEKVHEAIVMISDGTNLLGSGFLMSFPGGAKYVVTAYHVVKGAPIISGFPKLYVTLYDGSTWQAFFASRSEDADIAIIAATTRPDMTPYNSATFPSVTLSNSGDVKVGEAVF